MNNKVIYGDNLDVLRKMESKSVNLIYIDPPFNTGKIQILNSVKSLAVEEGGNVGFGGRRYVQEKINSNEYEDSFTDYYGFLRERLVGAYRILKDDGSLFFHIDWRESHYCRLILDEIFGRNNLKNELIWSYDFGGRPKNKWPCKHDTIFWYVKDRDNYTFNYDAIDRIPYLAPALVGAEKAERGKVPSDCWWNTIVPTNGHERTGYPTQKPMGILRRIILVHSNENDVVMDFFAGSGTTGMACIENNRNFIMVDENIEAIDVMKERFKLYDNVEFIEEI